MRAGEPLELLDTALVDVRQHRVGAAKGVAMIVANQAQEVLASEEAEVHLIDAAGVRTLPRASKLEQAREIVAAIARHLG